MGAPPLACPFGSDSTLPAFLVLEARGCYFLGLSSNGDPIQHNVVHDDAPFFRMSARTMSRTGRRRLGWFLSRTLATSVILCGSGPQSGQCTVLLWSSPDFSHSVPHGHVLFQPGNVPLRLEGVIPSFENDGEPTEAEWAEWLKWRAQGARALALAVQRRPAQTRGQPGTRSEGNRGGGRRHRSAV